MTVCAPLRLAASALPLLLLAPAAGITSPPSQILAMTAAMAQHRDKPLPRPQGIPPWAEEWRSPSKFKREDIVKADHEQNLKDSARIQELAAGVEKDFRRHCYAVLPTDALRKLDEIEKLTKGIRTRLRRS